MSKQSNQRYRKEKENEHLKKAGLGSSTADSGQSRDLKGKTSQKSQSDNMNP